MRDREKLFGEEVVEGFYGGEFVVFDVEHGVELGDVEDVVNFFGEAEEFEFAARVADGGEAADQFADAGGVDVIDAGEIEDDFFLAVGDELVDGLAEASGFVAEGDAAVEVEDGDVTDFASGDLHVGWADCTSEREVEETLGFVGNRGVVMGMLVGAGGSSGSAGVPFDRLRAGFRLHRCLR